MIGSKFYPDDAGNQTHANFVPRLAGFLCSAAVTLIVFFSVFHYGLDGEVQILLSSFLVFVFWLVMLMRSVGAKQYSPLARALIAAVLSFLSAYLAYTVWGTGMLNTDPLGAIAQGSNAIHNDTLYHVSIAQGILSYGCPSFLVNTVGFLNYHFGSHVLMALLSFVLDIPVYFVYEFLYPVFFFPAYMYLIFSVSERLRRFFSGPKLWSIPDFAVVLLFMIYEYPRAFLLWRVGIWKESGIVSESYLIGLIAAMLYLEVLFWAKEHGLFQKSAFSRVWEWVLTPVFILLTGICKISIGFFLCAGVMYYVFRMHTKELCYWLLNVCYGLCFLLLYFLPKMIDSPYGYNPMKISPFDFIKGYVVPRYLWLHVFLLYYLSFLLLFWRLRKKKLIQIIQKKQHVPEEILFWICLSGAIIANLLEIRDGSGIYFLYVQQLAALLLLVGYNVPDEVVHALKGSKRLWLKIFVGGLTACMGFFVFYNGLHDFKGYGDLLTARYHRNQDAGTASGLAAWFSPSPDANDLYVQLISRINELTDGHKRDYYLYVDESACIWGHTYVKDSDVRYYPAMTGVLAIGELYCLDGEMYYNDNTPFTGIWYKPNPDEPKMTLEAAVKKSRRDGKIALIHLYEDTLEVIPTR